MVRVIDDDGYASGELVLARVFNRFEDPESTGKVRPAVLIMRNGDGWVTMGLTTNPAHRDGTPRIPIRHPAAVGLNGPGYLWGRNTTWVSLPDLRRHIGWVDPGLAQAIIDLAELSGPAAEVLLEAAKAHRSNEAPHAA